MNLTREQITSIAQSVGLDYARLMAFISVESGGVGFDPATGKIIIQHEPHWMSKYLVQFRIPHKLSIEYSETGKKEYRITAGAITYDNGVEGQEGEWEAFNKAFQVHPEAAMLSTSIGLMQIMGFHWKLLGYKSVGEMWDSFKKGEFQQVSAGARFIQSQPALFKALIRKDWATVASLYNGPNYKVNNYDIKLEKAYAKYSKT